MDDIDILSLIDGEEMFSASYEVFKRTSSVLSVGGITISESTTIVETLSFGERSLDIDDIDEEYDEDLSWLL